MELNSSESIKSRLIYGQPTFFVFFSMFRDKESDIFQWFYNLDLTFMLLGTERLTYFLPWFAFAFNNYFVGYICRQERRKSIRISEKRKE